MDIWIETQTDQADQVSLGPYVTCKNKYVHTSDCKFEQLLSFAPLKVGLLSVLLGKKVTLRPPITVEGTLLGQNTMFFLPCIYNII